MKGIQRLIFGLICGLLAAGMVAAAPAHAAPAPKQQQGSHGALATTTATVYVTEYDTSGNVVATDTIQGPTVPIGTRVKITPTTIKVAGQKPYRHHALDSGGGGVFAPSTGCRTIHVVNVSKTTLGFTAFKWHMYVNECWNRPKATISVSSIDYEPSDVDSQYRYRGLAAGSNIAIGGPGRRVMRQGNFENCILKYGCINSYYPKDITDVYSNGQWWWETNG